MDGFGPWEIAIIAIVIIILFGSKKLPDAARSMGRSLRIFKSEIKGLHDDEPTSPPAAPPAELPAATPPAPLPPSAAAPSSAAVPGDRPDAR